MRIACLALLFVACSAERVERPPAKDPTSVAADEAPVPALPSYAPDPLLSPVPPRGAEPPPTGHDQAHSPTATPPGNPPLREAPGGEPAPPRKDAP
jgi:hypothetical protein